MLSFQINKTLKSKKIETYLQDNNKKMISPFFPFQLRKRAVLFTFKLSGVLTLEAAVVLPLFFLAVMSVLSFGQVLLVQMRIMGPLSNTARECAQSVYVQKLIENEDRLVSGLSDSIVGKSVSVLAAKKDIIDQVGEGWLETSGIVDGANGLSFLFSKVPDEDNMVDLVVHYRIKPVICFFPVSSIPITQRCRVHGWVGANEEKEATEGEETVYVTDTGAVYHRSLSCSHIQLSIRQMYIEDIENIRNASGGKYDPCELCADQGMTIVYVTDTGNRYHASLDCKGIKRGIKKTTRNEVGEKPVCKRCGG